MVYAALYLYGVISENLHITLLVLIHNVLYV